MENNDVDNRENLTSDRTQDHIARIEPAEGVLAEDDPRIIELVRFLARAAAEKDYAKLIDKSRMRHGREKDTIQ